MTSKCAGPSRRQHESQAILAELRRALLDGKPLSWLLVLLDELQAEIDPLGALQPTDDEV